MPRRAVFDLVLLLVMMVVAISAVAVGWHANDVAGGALELAGIAFIASVAAGLELKYRLGEIRDDVRRIADAVAPVASRSVPTYRLLSETGDDLGPFRAGTPTWSAGDLIHRGRDVLVVVSVTPSEDGDDVDGYLVVKPA